MNSPYLNDSLLAAKLFGIALFFLMCGAALDLNSFPLDIVTNFFAKPSLRTIAMTFGGYSLVFATMFWGSLPDRAIQRTVLFVWPILTAILWMVLYGELNFSGFDTIDNWIVLFGTGLGLPSVLAMLWRLWKPVPGSDNEVNQRRRWLLITMLLLIITPKAALELSATLHPYIYDLYALKFDAVAGWGITPTLVDAVDSIFGAKQILTLAYSFTPVGFLALALLQLRTYSKHVPNALLLWVVLSLCAVIAYHFFPITGPKYLFGNDGFVAKLRAQSILPIDQLLGQDAYARNGMPSMHFGWMFAVFFVWVNSNTRLWSRAILGTVTVLVALATLYLGEHYVIDLIVAVPFVLAGIALTTTNVPFKSNERWGTVAGGFACWIVWVCLLKTQIEFFLAHSWSCWLLLFATTAVVVMQLTALSRFKKLVDNDLPAFKSVRAELKLKDGLSVRMGLMFFVSGFAALIYQVLFAKELTLVFGSTATATFTVLATFLGGMAIGSLIGGYLAERVKRPIVVYAFVELGIAGFCVLTPFFFSLLQRVYVFLAADVAPDSAWLLTLRVILGASVLLIPTILMGITLPLLAQALNPRGDKLGHAIAWLYSSNTAGAALGALATSYAVIPLVGTHATTLLAALMNLLVALGALELAKRHFPMHDSTLSKSLSDGVASSINTPMNGKKGALSAAWIALGVGGVLSLGLEVVYVHMLSIVAGNSVYAFGLMLFTFLVGLAIGGECGRRILTQSTKDRAAWVAFSQLALAVAVILGAWAWDMIPGYFASFGDYHLVKSFKSREAVRALVCALVMIPPTICIGLSYTLSMDLATTASRRRSITMLGFGAALNTLGNIIGVLLFGFVLLPWLGGLVASKLIALAAMLVSAIILLQVERRVTKVKMSLALIASGMLLAASPLRLDYDALSSGANVYFAPQKWGKVVAHAESIDGGLTMVTNQQGPDQPITTLLTNGKFQGNDAKKGEVQPQIGFAALPLLHQPRRENALVIGYGTGATSRVLHDAGFAHIDIAELSRDVVKLADTYFSSINDKVSSQRGVSTHITDGRNFLLLTQRHYDVISIEITSIWFAGAASLYNREFYQLARTKLREDGVLQQWVQLHHMASTDLLNIVGTLRSEFNYVSLYVVGGQGILIATNDQSRSTSLPEVRAELDSSPRLQQVRELAGRNFTAIAGDLFLSPAQVDLFLDKIGLVRALWISNDDNLKLEYGTPKANANPPDQSFQKNMGLLNSVRKMPILKQSAAEPEQKVSLH